MATKKPSKPSKPSKPKPKPTSKPRLENLAARPTFDDDVLDEQLVDHSGVFRVTTRLTQSQTGHDESPSTRFPNESLVMAAQRDGFRDEAPAIDEEHVIEDEATTAEKRQRLLTLAARAAAKRR